MENQKCATVQYAPQRIAEARKKQGYSQEELALAAGLSLRTVQRIERGNVQPRLYSLRAIPFRVIDLWTIRRRKFSEYLVARW